MSRCYYNIRFFNILLVYSRFYQHKQSAFISKVLKQKAAMLASLPLVRLCRERKKSDKRRQDRVRINLGIGAWIMIIQVLKKTPKSKFKGR